MIYKVEKADRNIKGMVSLDGSKSISNRVLLIQALCKKPFSIKGISTSKDTQTLEKLLSPSLSSILDAGAAGTTFRFMTAYLAFSSGSHILTGSERMKQRPIGILVEALRKLGAQISYLERLGFPPLQIDQALPSTSSEIQIPADTSSQFISALLLIAPTLPKGLTLHLEGKIVSISYIKMTLSLLSYFGIDYHWKENTISIKAQAYQAKDITIEADWSAASYYFGIAALSKTCHLHLKGLYPNSWQGDAVVAELMENFGVKTQYTETGITLFKSNSCSLPEHFTYNFIFCPDIAQTLAVLCGALGIPATLQGLQTLKIKETDRTLALQKELQKVGVIVQETQKSKDLEISISGKASITNPLFRTYEDHRMAMSLSILAMLQAIQIENPEVVEKSYPAFYKDLENLNFNITIL